MPQQTFQVPRWMFIVVLALLTGLLACAVLLYLELRRVSADAAQNDETARARHADLLRGLKRAESHILNLYKLSENSPVKAPTDPPQRWHHTVVTKTPKEFVITTDSPTGGAITFRNTGQSRVQDIYMVINDRRWFRALDNAKWAVEGATTDREKAFLLWQYVCAHTYAWPPPDSNGPESRNAVKCLSVYGYGWSGELSHTLVQMAAVVGLEGRVRDLRGHVVPELFFDGAWRMLDPTLEVFYPDPERGGEPVGVDECAQNPSLVENVAYPTGQDPTLVADYYRSEPNPEDRAASFTTSPVGFRLGPGDEVSFSWVPIHFTRVDREMRRGDATLRPWEEAPGTIPWHSSVYAARPPYLNNAVFRTDPLSSQAAAKAFMLENARVAEIPGLASRDKPESRLGIMPDPDGGTARAALFVNVPLVITDARLSGFFLPSHPGDRCSVTVSTDDQVLQDTLLTATDASRPQPFALRIGAKLSGPKRPARYSYVVRIEMTLKDPTRGGLYGLRAETQCQMTPFTPWRLNHGENKIEVRTIGENTQCDLFFSWHEAHSVQHITAAPKGLRIEPGPQGRSTFRWDPPATSDGRPPDFYDIRLSERSDFAWPAVPSGFIEISADVPAWIAPQSFPSRVGTYYFHVRAKNAFGHPGPWSETLAFRAPQGDIVANPATAPAAPARPPDVPVPSRPDR